MMRTQAERLVERLKNACTFNRFDEPGVYAEYIRFLMRHDYDHMNEAIDMAIEDDSRNVPPISVLVKKYKQIDADPQNRAIVKNEEYCPVCDDRGFVMMKERHPEMTYNGEPLEYEYPLYCPFCPVGQAQAYNGSQCKDHKSPYRVPPLTEYFGDEGIQALREMNLKKRARKTGATRSMEKELQAIGKRIPDGWRYDVNGDLPF